MQLQDVEKLRLEIDEIDTQIIKLFHERQEAAKEIGKIKKELKLQVVDQERKRQALDARIKKAQEINLPEADVRDLFDFLHKKAVEVQS